MLAAAGLQHPGQLRPHHLMWRDGETRMRLLSEVHVFLRNGELLDGCCRHEPYASAWRQADARQFAPLPAAAATQGPELNDTTVARLLSA
jgi:hypothetical protein